MFEKEKRWLLEEKYAGIPSPAYENDVKDLERGVPLAYLIGHIDFLDLSIDLSHKPLIPRPETEYWTDIVRRDIRALPKKDLYILDIFAGSGCIGLALAKATPHAHVVLADNDPRAVEQIALNAERNNISNVTVQKSDMFADITGTFGVITANPPYIGQDAHDTVEPSVLAHEPHAALFATEGGLLYVEKTLREAVRFLTDDGCIYIEFGSSQETAIMDLYGRELKDIYPIFSVHNDQYDRPRFLKASKAA